MKSPLLTVLLPVRNGMPYLIEAVESILNQTFSAFEFLIIDDASMDGTTEFLATVAARDDRVRVLRRETSCGLGAALRFGMQQTRTSWVARMDADDIALPHRLERQMAFVDANPQFDIVGAWAMEIDNGGSALQTRTVPVAHPDIIKLLWANPMLHPTVVMRKSAIERAGSYADQVRRHEDYDLWFRCAAAKLLFANIPEVLLHYRTSGIVGRKVGFAHTVAQIRIGLRGCWRVRASPHSYVLVFGVLAKEFIARTPRPIAECGLWLARLLDQRARPRQP